MAKVQDVIKWFAARTKSPGLNQHVKGHAKRPLVVLVNGWFKAAFVIALPY